MDDPLETIEEYIVNSLAKMTDRALIIQEVCLRQNCFWDEGESLVNRIESNHRLQLEKKKNPLMLVLSSLFALSGLVLALFSFYALVAPIYIMWKKGGGLADGVVWIYNFWMLFTFLLMGTGMTISGLFGVIHSVKSLRMEEFEE
jgi:hypothetical protein